MSTPLDVVILAAGQGKRMHSTLPKALHVLAGRPLLGHALAAARALNPRTIHVVYGHGGEQVRTMFASESIQWSLQAQQLGTGHAVQQAMPAIKDDAIVLVLYGDVPLIRSETLQYLIRLASAETLALLTATVPDPRGYGRIVRDATGQVQRIVEHKDAKPEEAKVNEINTGILAAPATKLRQWLAQLKSHNAQSEYYLTDIVPMALAAGMRIVTAHPVAAWEILGVNSKRELADLERTHQRNIAERLLDQGVGLRDPGRLDVRGELVCGRDVVIDVNVVFEGKVTLADGVTIGANNVIRDTTVGAASEILPNCMIEDSSIGAHCRIGPFARIRPGAKLADTVHVGNFVEIKNSEIGAGSKANHLSYIGDASVGRNVNVGAGTITCNYDGANKHRTVIGDDVFIGSNTALIAPVTVAKGATIGAGSVINHDAPAGELTLARSPQQTITGWKRPPKKTDK